GNSPYGNSSYGNSPYGNSSYGNSYGSSPYGDDSYGGGSYSGSSGGGNRYGSGSKPAAGSSSGSSSAPETGLSAGVGNKGAGESGETKTYYAGMKVLHRKFGVGTVVSVKGNSLYVAFDKIGVKELSASLAPLTILKQ
ncbi:MAG: hypothetical protein LUE27_03080, partial [Clostridia bacterium]|nr:hypothetical protein [Clostridia bacterium]